MKRPVTFLRVSEGGKIEVSGNTKPDNPGEFNYPAYEKAIQSFSDSFIVVENPELVLNNTGKFFKPDQYKVMGREVPKVEDGLYPIQGLEFEVNQQCLVDGDWIDFDKMTVTKEAKFKRKVAIVSLVEPSKEEKYEEREKLFPQWNHEYPQNPPNTERLGEKTEVSPEYYCSLIFDTIDDILADESRDRIKRHVGLFLKMEEEFKKAGLKVVKD